MVNEIFNEVTNLAPFVTGTTPSTAFCCLFKMWTLRLTVKQLENMIDHPDSVYIRAIGFLYLRYVCAPAQLWDWLGYYLDDEQELNVSNQPKPQMMTLGQFCRMLLTEQKYYGTMLPRIPVPIARDLEKKLVDYDREKEREKKGSSKSDRYSSRSRSRSPDRSRRRRTYSRSRSRSISPRRHRRRSRSPPSRRRDDRSGSRRRDERDELDDYERRRRKHDRSSSRNSSSRKERDELDDYERRRRRHCSRSRSRSRDDSDDDRRRRRRRSPSITRDRH
ncbi:unnamed protein product [Cunninghamella echinulata]